MSKANFIFARHFKCRALAPSGIKQMAFQGCPPSTLAARPDKIATPAMKPMAIEVTAKLKPLGRSLQSVTLRRNHSHEFFPGLNKRLGSFILKLPRQSVNVDPSFRELS